MMLQGLPIAMLLFVLFPRLAPPLWGLPSDYAAKSGLSDSMRPGQISELSLSDAVAFRVEFDGAVPPPASATGAVPSSRDSTGPSGRLRRSAPRRAAPRRRRRSATPSRSSQQPPWLFALDLPASLPRPVGEPTPRRRTRAHHAGPAGPLGTPVTQSSATRNARCSVRRYASTPPARSAANLRLRRGNARTHRVRARASWSNPDHANLTSTPCSRSSTTRNSSTRSRRRTTNRNPVDMFMFDGGADSASTSRAHSW